MKIPGTSSWSTCVLIGVGFMLSCCGAQAQKPRKFDQMVEFSTMFDQAGSKFIHEGVRDQDPGALIWIDVAVQQVLVRAHVELDREQLQAVVTGAGLHITYLGPPRMEADAAKSLRPTDGDQLPAYRNSGDPAADNARYEMEKKAWVQAHPDLYQQQLAAPAPEE